MSLRVDPNALELGQLLEDKGVNSRRRLTMVKADINDAKKLTLQNILDKLKKTLAPFLGAETDKLKLIQNSDDIHPLNLERETCTLEDHTELMYSFYNDDEVRVKAIEPTTTTTRQLRCSCLPALKARRG